MRRRDRSPSITSDELSLLIALVADLDAEKYAKPRAKALIYKCRGIIEANPETVWVVQ